MLESIRRHENHKSRRDRLQKEGCNNDQGGYVIVLVGISALTFILMVGFAVDLGNWYLKASKLQRASDTAALAGATKMPDLAAATAAAAEVYKLNGYENGVDNVNLSYEPGANGFRATANDSRVETYFISMVMRSVSITREASAKASSAAPIIGSPFNVLGSGDLDIAGISPNQNFWLAVNGFCSAREDGDYFTSKYINNKGPFGTTFDPVTKDYTVSGSTRHNCDSATQNPEWNESGYSYYVDVPKPPSTSDYVDIEIFDPAFQNTYDGDPDQPDLYFGYPSDTKFSSVETTFNVFNATDTDVQADQPSVMPNGRAVMFFGQDERDGAGVREWGRLVRIPASSMPNGGVFRVQVFVRGNPGSEGHAGDRGVNAFSIGAWASWVGDKRGCDTRTDDSCPAVYSKTAFSVFNNLGGGVGSKVPFFFAEIKPAFVGGELDLMLWDVAEGVEKLELLGPDGTPLSFNWSVQPTGSGLSGTSVDEIRTDLVDATPRPGTSNAYSFNDRLLKITVRIPPEYEQMVERAEVDGDRWMRLAYTINNSPNDRTTWGVIGKGSEGGPSHLVRPR